MSGHCLIDTLPAELRVKDAAAAGDQPQEEEAEDGIV